VGRMDFVDPQSLDERLAAWRGDGPPNSPEFEDMVNRGLAEVDEKLREFYEKHPASKIPPHACPPLPEWKQVDKHTKTHGELVLQVRFDPCRTWSATLSRKAVVGKLNARTQVHAIFYARVNGAKDREDAERAVIEAARTAGWLG
jgi:hypothetical protein